MAFVNAHGVKVSHECTELIEELEADIAEFGEDDTVAVWCKQSCGVEIYTNYDFIKPENVKEYELAAGEYIKSMTMGELLALLEQQNAVL